MNLHYTNNGDCRGTYLCGHVKVTFCEIVRVFGAPNHNVDRSAADVAWIGTINDLVFTLYNWRYSYHKIKAVEDVTFWRVGGNSPKIAELVALYMAHILAVQFLEGGSDALD